MRNLLWRGWNGFISGIEWALVILPGRHLAGVAVVSLVVLAAVLALLPLLIQITVGDRLGWYGVALGVFGFWYTVSQLYLTRKSVEAARNAADETERRAATAAYQSRVERTLEGVRLSSMMVNQQRWRVANIRLEDAAQELRRVQVSRRHLGDRWNRYAERLSVWAIYFATQAEGRRIDGFDPDRWVAEVHEVLAALEAELAAPAAGGM